MTRANFNICRETKPFTSARVNVLTLMREISDCKSVLDIGCGKESLLRFSKAELLVGVDAFEQDVELARKRATHDELSVCDAMDLAKRFSGR